MPLLNGVQCLGFSASMVGRVSQKTKTGIAIDRGKNHYGDVSDSFQKPLEVSENGS